MNRIEEDDATEAGGAGDVTFAAMFEALTFIADLPDPGEHQERSATFYRCYAANLKQAAAKALGRQTVSQEALDWAEEWATSDEGRAALSLTRGEPK